jgi:hypothetical protein
VRNLFLALAFGLAFIVSPMAQTTPENPTRSMQQDSQPASLASSVNQGEKKISGCLRQEKEKFALENGHHKKIWLSGPEDFASHAGHTVTLYGNFLTTSAPSKRSAPRSNQGTDFQVTRMETMSPTCETEKSKVSKSQNQH